MEKEHKKEHKHEHHEHHKPEFVEKKAFKMPNVWMIASALLLIALVVVLATRSPSATGMGAAQCGQQTVAYLNNNLVQPGTQATLESVNEESGVYAIVTDYLNRSITVYTTKDCSLLFLSSLNTTQELPDAEETQTQEMPEVTKTDKPVVELYVMSFCPYGVQAENAMKPVADLLGAKADIKVRFIVNIGGTNISDVSSLHGIEEAKEDVRQLCVMKYYPSKFWSYLMDINENCYSLYRDSAAMDACWKNASAKQGIDTAKIEACAYGSEGIALLSSDETLTEQYGISGSPTLMINGVRYSGARTPEAFKEAICSAFNNPPAECSQTLSEDGSAASGNC